MVEKFAILYMNEYSSLKHTITVVISTLDMMTYVNLCAIAE